MFQETSLMNRDLNFVKVYQPPPLLEVYRHHSQGIVSGSFSLGHQWDVMIQLKTSYNRG